jgi:hypothetical protein
MQALSKAVKANCQMTPDNKGMEVFINAKNIQLLPYLKLYNGVEDNYEEIARLYIDSRGRVLGKKFGF